jgi:hypothetical protein
MIITPSCIGDCSIRDANPIDRFQNNPIPTIKGTESHHKVSYLVRESLMTTKEFQYL